MVKDLRPVVVVTGCSYGGIGYEMSRFFAESGCRVFSSDVKPMVEMLELETRGIDIAYMDVSSEESVNEGIENIIRKAGRIDILVNNAGVPCSGPLAEVALSDVRRAFNVNVLGTLALIQAVVPHMVLQGGGKIVNVGSVLGLVPCAWEGAYAATKTSVHAISDVLRIELQPFDIKVVTLTPGAIRSNITGTSQHAVRAGTWRLYPGFVEAFDFLVGVVMNPKAAVTPEDYARKVVEVVLQETPPRRSLSFLTGGITFAVAAVMAS